MLGTARPLLHGSHNVLRQLAGKRIAHERFLHASPGHPAVEDLQAPCLLLRVCTALRPNFLLTDSSQHGQRTTDSTAGVPTLRSCNVAQCRTV